MAVRSSRGFPHWADGAATAPPVPPPTTAGPPGPSSSSSSSSRHSSEAHGPSLVQAFCVIVQETVQLKYGLSLDRADLSRKVREAAAEVWAHGRDPAGGLSGPAALVAALNSRPDLRLRVCGTEGLAALRVECFGADSFDELWSEVRRTSGTARALAVVASFAAPAADGRAARCPPPPPAPLTLTALAVFREDYARSRHLVGRGVDEEPLVSFGAGDLRTALVLDPEVLRVHRGGGGGGQPGAAPEPEHAPPLREEYASLCAWNLADDSAQCAHGTSSSHMAPEAGRSSFSSAPAGPWPQVLAAALEDDCAGGPAPTAQWLRRLRRVLEHPDADEEPVLQLLQRLVFWLGQPDAAAAVRRELADAGLPGALVGLLWRAGAHEEEEEVVRGGRPTPPAVSAQACQAIGLSVSRGSSDGAAASFAAARGVMALCGIMRRCQDDGETLAAAIFALQAIVKEDDSAAATALSLGAPQLIHLALAAHPRNTKLQRSGGAAAQTMAARAAALADTRLDVTLSHAGVPSVPTSSSLCSSAAAAAAAEAAPREEGRRTCQRRGLAALLERRAADAARPSIVAAALGWLFPGGGSAPGRRRHSPQQGQSEVPHGGGAPSAEPPKRCLPFPSPPAAVPRLELHKVEHNPSSLLHCQAEAGPSPVATPVSADLSTQAASGASSARAAKGRRATSRPAPAVATEVHDARVSPRDYCEESPSPPPAVRFNRRRGEAQPSPPWHASRNSLPLEEVGPIARSVVDCDVQGNDKGLSYNELMTRNVGPQADD